MFGEGTEVTGSVKLCISTGRYFRGGETFVNRHIEHLFGGNTVVVCGRQTGQNTLNKPVFSRAQAHLNPLDLVTAPLQLLQNHHRYSAPFVPFKGATARLERFLRDHEVDAILAEFGSQAVSIWPVARAMGLPVFSYFRGRDASLYLQNAYRVEGYRRMMPELAGIFAVSDFLLRNLAEHGLRHANSHVVPSGTDTQAFKPGVKRAGQMLYVGRFVEKKAPRLTLESFLSVAAKHPHARLDFVGDGPLLATCRALAETSPFGDRVTFHGRQSPHQVQQHLAQTDIFVLHSVTGKDGETEGLPSAIQEAMAAGAAILSTRHAGIPELVEQDVTGALVDELDGSALVAAMDRMLGTPEATRQMGQTARTTAEERIDFRGLYRHVEAVISRSVEQSAKARSR